MNKYYSYINTAKEVLKVYKGREPLASFLKKYFSASKKFGSTDRKQISHLCYSFFRTGKMKLDLPVEERILAALFLSADKPSEMLAALKPDWNDKVDLPLHEKSLIINHSLLITGVFPWNKELSGNIEHEKFCESFLVQPDLFIRLRPGKEELVVRRLQDAGMEFNMISETCLGLPNSSKIDDVIEIDKEAIVQDYSSQRTGRFLSYAIDPTRNNKRKVWDCCAGSGGKSIMAYDIDPTIELVVSDIRESILANLKKRFQKAGIKNYQSFITDLTSKRSDIRRLASDIIICDAPCTGSGTWSRTPEQLYFFNEEDIEKFASLQKKIVSNVIPQLQPGGSFIYITCSVFKKENEEVVEHIKEKFHLQLKRMEVLTGYDKKADSMFVAVLGSTTP